MKRAAQEDKKKGELTLAASSADAPSTAAASSFAAACSGCASPFVGDEAAAAAVGDAGSSALAGFCLSFLPNEMLRNDHFFFTLSFFDLDLMLSSASGEISSVTLPSLASSFTGSADEVASPPAPSALAAASAPAAPLFSVVRSLSFSEFSSVSFFYKMQRKLLSTSRDFPLFYSFLTSPAAAASSLFSCGVAASPFAAAAGAAAA